MNKYQSLIDDIIRFGALSYSMGMSPDDGTKRDRAIKMEKITKQINLMSLQDQLREAAAPTRLKSSEVDAIWMTRQNYMKPQAFAAAVQDAAGVP